MPAPGDMPAPEEGVYASTRGGGACQHPGRGCMPVPREGGMPARSRVEPASFPNVFPGPLVFESFLFTNACLARKQLKSRLLCLCKENELVLFLFQCK